MLKDATPLTAATVAVPTSEALPGLVPMATEMLPVKLVAMLPKASKAVTATAGANAAPAAVVRGWTLNAIVLAAAGTMANVPLVATVRPVADAVKV